MAPHHAEHGAQEHPHDHGRDRGDHEHDHGHDHSHPHEARSGIVPGWLRDFFHPHGHDPAESVASAVEASAEGIRAVKISLAALGLTAVLQLVVVGFTGSVALLADTIHNFADASTAIPLWIAFSVGRRAASRRYTYGYRRAEDLAGLFVLLMIAGSAGLAGWESIARLMNPHDVGYPAWIFLAGVLGFAGNEFVARYRIRVGRRIGSEALVADGVHARTDALTSLAVAVGSIGVFFGFQQADALVGLLISLLILVMLKDTSLAIFRRMMDAVDPRLVDHAEAVIAGVAGVRGVERVRMRWVGHRLHVDAEIAVGAHLDVTSAHRIAEDVHHTLLHDVAGVQDVTVHVHPDHTEGDSHEATSHHRSALAHPPSSGT
jgi:cation diffusion facilitator family transporter